MHIVYATADGGRDFRGQARAATVTRRRDLLEVASALSLHEVDLLVFPAGYFQVPDDAARGRLIASLAADLYRLQPAVTFGIVCGIDLPSTGKGGGKRPRRAGHRYFVFHRAPSGVGTDVALLICGKSWSDVLLERVADSRARALVVAAYWNVNLHTESTGCGKLSWHRRLDAFSRQQCLPVVLAEHTRSPQRHAYSWPPSISKPLQLSVATSGLGFRVATV